MSAIWGILRFDGQAVATRDLERMAAVLGDFGPDDRGVIAHDAIGLGHCLLRVNREDRFEAQPIHDRDARLTIVADIRLDNRAELADALGLDRAVIADWPDSAFLVPAWRRWGEATPEHLIGDFTFAVWDAAAQKLILARDHMGQRGLFWHANAAAFVFATQVEALWSLPGVPRALSDVAFARRLTRDLSPRRGGTPYRDISVVEPASVLSVAVDGARAERIYWHPQAAEAHLDRDEAWYLSAYRAVLEEAVACRVRRLETPPALLMSGAFDSGAIAAFAGPIAAAKGRKLIAVSEVLPEGEARPPVRDARAAMEAFRAYPWIDIHYRTASDEGLYVNLDSEFASGGIAATTQFAERALAGIAAGQGARLLMDGYGGDYTLHVRSANMLGRLLRRGRLGAFAREFRMRMRKTGHSAWSVARRDVIGALVPLWLQRFTKTARRRFRPAWHESIIASPFARRLIADGTLDPDAMRVVAQRRLRWRDLSRDLIARAGRYPAPLRAAAGHAGMEFTRPFHDKRVVELALALPEDLLFRDGLDRWLPRTALVDRLPERLIHYAGGNTSANPGQFRVTRAAMPRLLGEIRELDRAGEQRAYIDFARVEALLADLDESRRVDHIRLHIVRQALLRARHRLWFDRSNRQPNRRDF
jgi:asparagine synthase (glutamine-hydrolysing)